MYTGNSGTTTRLLAGLLSGLGIESVLSGDVSIGKRPMDRVLRPLKLMDANIEGIEDNYTPLIIKPSVIKGINYQMEVASAQVKSAILFASLFSKEPTIIKELDVSRNHTETMFKHFNIPIEAEGLSITTTLMPFNILNLQIFMFLAIFHLQRSLLLQHLSHQEVM